jgi:hypothetical protein
MAENKHAPEPWRIEDNSEGHDGIVDAGGHLCAESWPGDTMNLDPLLPQQFIERQDANARRIVACVNALDEAPTAALEREDVREALEAFISALNSQLRGELDGWEVSLIERRLRALGRLDP